MNSLKGFDTKALAGIAKGFAMNLSSPAEPKEDAHSALPKIQDSPEAHALLAIKKQAWELARAAAHARTAHLNLPEDDARTWPTVDDYFVASRTPEIRAMAAASNPPVPWNAKTATDFKGMELRNVIIGRDDLRTPKPVGYKPDPANADQQLPVYDAAKRESLHMTDEEISDFYAEVSTNISFDDTKFYNVHFHPADTFDEYVRDKNVECHNVTFDGIDRAVHLTRGTFEGIKFINIEHGEIVVGAEDAKGPAKVDGMDIRSVRAKITLHGNAMVDHLKVDNETRILQLDMKPGAKITNSNLGDATITMTSKLEGIELNNVQFKGTSLSGVDMQGAKLTKVSLDKAELKGLNLKGATLIDVTIDGQPVTKELLQSLQVEVDDKPRISSLHPQQQQQKIEAKAETKEPAKEAPKKDEPIVDLGKGLLKSMRMAEAPIVPPTIEDMGTKMEARRADLAAQPAVFQKEQLVAEKIQNLNLRIQGGEDIKTLDQAFATGAGKSVASNDMGFEKAPVQQQESISMLMAKLSGKLGKAQS